MEPRIETRASTTLVGMRNRAATGGGGTAELWRRFMPERNEIGERVGADLISMRIFHRAPREPLTPATPFDEWAAVEVSVAEPVPSGMEFYVVPSGMYAVFCHRGPASTFPQTAHYIFATWLPSSSYELDTRPHLAVMGADYRLDDPNAEEEIWVPVTAGEHDAVG